MHMFPARRTSTKPAQTSERPTYLAAFLLCSQGVRRSNDDDDHVMDLESTGVFQNPVFKQLRPAHVMHALAWSRRFIGRLPLPC